MAYNRRMTMIHGNLLMVALFGLLIPAIFHYSVTTEREISLEIATILFMVYMTSVIYILLVKPTDQQITSSSHIPTALDNTLQSPGVTAGRAEESSARATIKLVLVTMTLAAMSEILTGAIEPAATSWGLTPIFAGVFLLAMVGNAAQFIIAVRFARLNQFDVVIGMTVGSSTQVALLVAPVLVFASTLFGNGMNLVFSQFELIAIIMSVIIINRITDSGFLTFMGGVVLMAVYVILAFAFYSIPVTA